MGINNGLYQRLLATIGGLIWTNNNSNHNEGGYRCSKREGKNAV